MCQMGNSVDRVADLFFFRSLFLFPWMKQMKALGQTEGEKADSNGLSYAKLD